MRRIVLIAIAALFVVAPSFGQDFDIIRVPDTLFRTSGAYHVCKIKHLPTSARHIKAKTIGRRFEKIVRLPMEKVAKISFADGFSIDVNNGVFDRSNLLSAPKIGPKDNRVVVEDVIDLIPSEVRSFYGNKLYYGEYIPMRVQSITGCVRFGVGFGGIIYKGVTTGFDPAYNLKWLYLLGFNMKRNYKGVVDPAMISTFSMCRGMLLSGVTDMIIANAHARDIFNNRATMNVQARKWAWTEILVGTAAAAAGFGVMAYEWSVMDKYKGKYYSYSSVGPAFQKDMAQAFVLSNLGALVANFGISAIIKGSTRLITFNKTGLGIAYNF